MSKLLGALLLALAASGGGAQEGFHDTFVVIVHPTMQGGQIKRETLAAVFLKQMTRWGDGAQIAPVEQSTRSAVRQAFSTQVLGQSVLSVQNFWTQQIAAGRGVPPTTKGSDAEVAAFVAEKQGAIGYVSAEFGLPAGVKLLKVIE